MSKAFYQSITDRIARYHHDRNAFCGLLGGSRRLCSIGDNNVRLKSDKLGRERGKAVRSVIEPPLDKKVLAFAIAQITQPLSDWLLAGLRCQHSDTPFAGSRLLRMRRERQRRCPAGDKCDEFPPLHYQSRPDALNPSVCNFQRRSKRSNVRSGSDSDIAT